MVQCPVTGVECDLSITTYADDVRKVNVELRGDDKVQGVVEQVAASNMSLDNALHSISMAQHTGKQEHVAHYRGRGASAATRQHYAEQPLPGKTVQVARYLGGYCQYSQPHEHELCVRIRKATDAWRLMGPFWSRGGQSRSFRGLVLSTLLSGLHALVLTDAQIARLDKFVLKCGRKLMRGTAVEKTVLADGSTKFRTVSEEKVWKFLGM
eukprot:9220305-Alexandrium_andersonii.AAC.1